MNIFQQRETFKTDLLYKIETILQKEKWLTKVEIDKLFDLDDENLSIAESMKSQFKQKILRDIFIETCSFAIPSLEAIECICSHSPILEIGCGTGFWSMLLQKHGCDIIATEPNHYTKTWTNVLQIDALTAQSQYPNRTLFTCWPYNSGKWQVKLLQKADKIIFVGEWSGCTGSDDFFKVLSEDFEKIHWLPIPKWSGINDSLYIMKRKSL